MKIRNAILVACAGCVALAPPARAQLVPFQGLPGIDTELGVELFGLPFVQRLRSESPNDYRLRTLFSPQGGVDITLERRFGDAVSGFTPALWGRVTTLERRRFYGWGNDTDAPLPSTAYQFRPFEASLDAGLLFERGNVRLSLGPEFRHVRTDLDAELSADGDGDADDTPLAITSLRPYGAGGFSQIALAGALEARTAGPADGAHAGVGIALTGRLSPALLDVTTAYATATAEAQGFVSLDLPGSPLFAARVGVETASAGVPYFDAAYVGGYGRLRGYHSRRYSGTGAVWAGLENRLRIGGFSLRGKPISFGTLAFADVGRVTLAGNASRGFHTSYGGGIWFGLEHGPTASLTMAEGDGTRIYLRLGLLDWR